MPTRTRTSPETPPPAENFGHIKLHRMQLDKMRPADYNPRIMTMRARQGLSNSLSQFGLLQPIIWNRTTGNIVGGHQRYHDLISKGVKETDVVIVELSPEKETALNIALNSTAISGTFTESLTDLINNIMDTDLKSELLLDDLVNIDDIDKGDVNIDGDGFADKDQFTEKDFYVITAKIPKIEFDAMREDFDSYMKSLDIKYKVS